MTKKLITSKQAIDRYQKWIESARAKLSKLTDRAVKTKAKLLATIAKHESKIGSK